MFSWLSRFTKPVVPPATTRPRPAPAPAQGNGDATLASVPTEKISTWAWLLNAPPPHDGPLATHERALLAPIQDTLALETLPDNLVPRASAVIPQLMRALRQESGSRKEVVERIAKDQLLTAEVLRLVRSPLYRTQTPVASLDAAVSLIGTAGVQSAISRVVLKPIFAQTQQGLVALASGRTWQLAERQGEVCAGMATEAGLEWFDGFLAGTLHGVGRTALLKILDTAPSPGLPLWPCSQAWDTALSGMANQLFAKLALQWDIAPTLTAAAIDVLQGRNIEHASPLAHLWEASEQRTLQILVQDAARAPL